MKTAFTPGHYHRRVATKMAIRLVHELFEGAA